MCSHSYIKNYYQEDYLRSVPRISYNDTFNDILIIRINYKIIFKVI